MPNPSCGLGRLSLIGSAALALLLAAAPTWAHERRGSAPTLH